jgi:VanZ family protein
LKILAIIFTIFIIIIILLADTGRLGFVAPLYDFPYGDKVGHFILFGFLTFLIILTVLRSHRYTNPKRIAVYWALFLALLITVEEFSQTYFASRTFDLLDLSFSYLGTAMGLWMAWKLVQKSR